MTRLYHYLQPAILILAAINAVFYFEFTAEDAFITYRYAENLVNFGALVYNQGEPINAMTSPLHTMISAALYFATGHTVLSNKIFALLLVLVSAILVWIRFRNHPHWQLLTMILVLMPPSIWLWTFGGLETTILLFLATVTVLLVERSPSLSLGRLCLIFFLTGLAFLTRYDSVLFFLPVVVYAALKARSVKHVVAALMGAAGLPILWLAVSMFYYGDVLPTSFYVKTPNGNLGSLLFNGTYVASYLLYVGLIPVVGLAVAILLSSRPNAVQLLQGHFRGIWWLYLGLLLELCYGLTMATHHMMFSFRFFVPYLPSAAILVVGFVRHAAEAREVDLSARGKPAFLFAGFLLGLTLFQIYQIAYTYNHSVNGISRVGEYRSLGIRDYVEFLQILKQEAVDIEIHWSVVNGDGGRNPRIITYAAGMLPYTYRESYIYEKLVSYRHCHERYQQGLHADYLHIIAPRQGHIDEQLPGPDSRYSLVSSYEMLFDGSLEKFLVYYNPRPEAHNLTAGIYDPCKQGERAAN